MKNLEELHITRTMGLLPCRQLRKSSRKRGNECMFLSLLSQSRRMFGLPHVRGGVSQFDLGWEAIAAISFAH